jgi:hypothetical protein
LNKLHHIYLDKISSVYFRDPTQGTASGQRPLYATEPGLGFHTGGYEINISSQPWNSRQQYFQIQKAVASR